MQKERLFTGRKNIYKTSYKYKGTLGKEWKKANLAKRENVLRSLRKNTRARGLVREIASIGDNNIRLHHNLF